MSDYNLFVVHVQREATAVVVAKDAKDAKDVAYHEASTILDDCCPDVDAWVDYELDKPPLPAGWHGDEFPYEARGMPEEVTSRLINEWLAPDEEPRGPEDPIPDVPGQVIMPFAEGQDGGAT